MKCYHHPDRDAVAYCSQCGRGLCGECSDRYNPILCGGCAEKIAGIQLNEEIEYYNDAVRRLRKLRIGAIVCVAFGILFGLALTSGRSYEILGLIGGILGGLCFAGVPSGWRDINETFSRFRFILFLPIAGWIMFYLFKLSFAIVVGWIAFPREYFALKKIVKQGKPQ